MRRSGRRRPPRERSNRSAGSRGISASSRRAALAPRQLAQVLALEDQHVVEPHEGRDSRRASSSRPVLRPSRCCSALKLAAPPASPPWWLPRTSSSPSSTAGIVSASAISGKRAGDVVAGARVEPRLAAGVDQLHADAVPFPLGDVVGEVEHRVLERVGEHERAEQRHRLGVGRRRAVGGPGEQLGDRAAPSACQYSSTSSTATSNACANAVLASRAEMPTRIAPVASLSSA